MADLTTTNRSKAIREIEISLGGSMVDVELNKEDYDFAIDKAVSKYRQRSSRAVEESFMVLKLSANNSSYTLPDEVIEVRTIYRPVTGGLSSSSTNFQPFEAGFLNTYMLNSSGGGLARIELLMGQRETFGKMFGAHLLFNWSNTSKQLNIQRIVRVDEEVVLQTYNYRPDDVLLADTSSGQWIKEYASAIAKMILGQARSKFASLAGPQGGVQLNGADLIAQGQIELDKLEEDIKFYADGGTPVGFIFG